jgi:hypothetical protein
VKNALNHPRAQRAIALLFLALVLVGVVAGLTRSVRAEVERLTRELHDRVLAATPSR